ncbi:MAG: MarR family winged helix-turn-helix transcriptional regulator, partial [Sphingomonas sp.]
MQDHLLRALMANLESLTSSFASLFMRLHRLADRRMAEQGASLARTKVLLFVRKHGGTARAADIAECFNQAPRTITEAIDALEREGLLRRTPDPSDRRVKRIARLFSRSSGTPVSLMHPGHEVNSATPSTAKKSPIPVAKTARKI